MATGLATRCSACSTVFRVVPDQLRVSEGWVRCGRCSQVFNALEGLVDLDTGLPKQAAGSPAHPGADAPAESEFEIAHPAARPGSPPLPPFAPAGTASPAGRGPSAASADFGADSRLHRPPHPSQADSAAENVVRNADGHASGHAVEHASEKAAENAATKPSFVRSAERAERWRSPKVRAALAATALLATLTLVAQASLQYRDLLAAHVPETRPWLDQACATLGCRVEAARFIEHLAVDSSGLVRVEKSNLYKLQLTLRNRGGVEVAVPALDLTLSDGQGRLIARKVLRLSELGTSQATIAAGRELAVLATVQAAAAGDMALQPALQPALHPALQPIAGYTIELFYP